MSADAAQAAPPAQLPSVLTLREAAQAADALARWVATAPTGGPLSVDASALRQIDSAALAVLLAGQRAAQARGAALQVEGAPASLLALARLYGVTGLVGLEPAAG